MARNYGRTATSIWRDKDFRQLSPEARFTYMMLFNQPNISAVGVLELTVTRWAGHTGYSIDVVTDALNELAKREYIVVDEEAEEVFIRSFVRWDGGANNDLRRKAIRETAETVASDEIRASIALQLDRLGVEHHLSIPPAGPIDTRRVVVKEGDQESNPQPATRNPLSATPGGEPEPLSADASAGPPSMFCSKHPNGTEEPCGPCADARKRYAAWAQADVEAKVEAKRVAAEARKACPLCDDHGRRIDPNTRLPIGRCDHQPADLEGAPS